MSNRLDLHNLLLSIAGPNVYYQVPSGMAMKYPCVKYTLDDMDNSHANNNVYKQDKKYTITFMSKNVDDPIVDKLSKMQKCTFDRRFIQDNIYHTTFSLYF